MHMHDGGFVNCGVDEDTHDDVDDDNESELVAAIGGVMQDGGFFNCGLRKRRRLRMQR
jgi:hypothetical protein